MDSAPHRWRDRAAYRSRLCNGTVDR